MIKSQEIKMKPHEIAKAILTWPGGCYFIGDACGKCNCTVNTFGSAPGWFCPNPDCDHFNNQLFHGGPMPWNRPNYGPTKLIIHKGGKLSQRDTRRQRKFADNQKVFVNLRSYPFRASEGEWRQGRVVRMRDKNYCGLRWYIVGLRDGTKRQFYEADVCTELITTIINGGGKLLIQNGDAKLDADRSAAWSTSRGSGGVVLTMLSSIYSGLPSNGSHFPAEVVKN